MSLRDLTRDWATRATLCAAMLVATLAMARAEDVQWVIAAEKFAAQGVPKVYESFPESVPRLLLARIGSIKERMILPDEKELRKLQELSSARYKLIRERADLILERDRVVLAADDSLVKRRKRNDAKKKITEKEKAIADNDAKIKELLAIRQGDGKVSREFSAEKGVVSLWKGGTELYAPSDPAQIGPSLAKDKIHALIRGTVQDIAGYLYVTVTLDTGVNGIVYDEVSEAASYDDVDLIVSSLAVRMLPQIANRKAVRLDFSVEPKGAELYVDGRLIAPDERTVTVFEGDHTLSASAPGYETVTKKKTFEGSESFKVTIALVEEKTVSVAFDVKGDKASLFLNTRYVGDAPATVSIPLRPIIGEAIADDAKTWFVFIPDADLEEGTTVTLATSKSDTETKIKKARNAFYWSLGALYLSLPVSMLSYGVAMDKYDAYNDGRMSKTDGSADDVNRWMKVSEISRGVSIALGVNVAFQLVRYILAANGVIPKFAKSKSRK